MSQKVYFVGSHAEVAHHAAPLANEIDVHILLPDEVEQIAEPGDLAIFFSEHFDRFRRCISQLKSRGIATLYMIDGILEWRNAWENRPDEPACPWTMRPALCDKVACIGYSQVATLNSWGNSRKTELVGIPRFDQLRKANKINGNERSTFRILAMSAKCPGFTPTQVANTLAGFRDLKQWATDHPSIDGRTIELVWRLTGDLADNLGVENSCNDLAGPELVESLQSVDAVITTPSTAMLEAMLLDRPVAILDYNHTPQLASAAWTISAAEQIDQTIQELICVPATKLAYQQTTLDLSLLPTDQSTARMVDLIRRMLQHSIDGNVDYPPNMLGSCDIGVELGFDHSNLFPNYPEFANPDLVETQSQLAHSRREIDHLHGEIDQLKRELDQAHEIFEQIHQHPVAGPIVRLRQRLMDWMGRNRQKEKSSESPTAPAATSTTPAESTVSP
jgi:hypothetical protein